MRFSLPARPLCWRCVARTASRAHGMPCVSPRQVSCRPRAPSRSTWGLASAAVLLDVCSGPLRQRHRWFRFAGKVSAMSSWSSIARCWRVSMRALCAPHRARRDATRVAPCHGPGAVRHKCRTCGECNCKAGITWREQDAARSSHAACAKGAHVPAGVPPGSSSYNISGSHRCGYDQLHAVPSGAVKRVAGARQ